MKHEFHVVYTPIEDGWFLASVPELPGAVTQGRTLKEAQSDDSGTRGVASRIISGQCRKGCSRRCDLGDNFRGRSRIMKRREFIEHLLNHGCQLDREGAKHSIYRNPANGRCSGVPRHREIKNTTARAICDQLGIPRPPTR